MKYYKLFEEDLVALSKIPNKNYYYDISTFLITHAELIDDEEEIKPQNKAELPRKLFEAERPYHTINQLIDFCYQVQGKLQDLDERLTNDTENYDLIIDKINHELEIIESKLSHATFEPMSNDECFGEGDD